VDATLDQATRATCAARALAGRLGLAIQRLCQLQRQRPSADAPWAGDQVGMGQSTRFEPVLELRHRLLLTNEVKCHRFGNRQRGWLIAPDPEYLTTVL
jgi:hypothetical protein